MKTLLLTIVWIMIIQIPLLYLGDSFLDRLEMKAKNPGGTLGLKVVLIIMCIFFLLDLPNQYS